MDTDSPRREFRDLAGALLAYLPACLHVYVLAGMHVMDPTRKGTVPHNTTVGGRNRIGEKSKYHTTPAAIAHIVTLFLHSVPALPLAPHHPSLHGPDKLAGLLRTACCGLSCSAGGCGVWEGGGDVVPRLVCLSACLIEGDPCATRSWWWFIPYLLERFYHIPSRIVVVCHVCARVCAVYVCMPSPPPYNPNKISIIPHLGSAEA